MEEGGCIFSSAPEDQVQGLVSRIQRGNVTVEEDPVVGQ